MTTTNAHSHPFAAQLQEHGYHLHGLAALFPPMQPEEFEALKESIRQNGQREPALLFGSLLLDGVHRVRACIELGIEPKIVKVAGTGAELRSRVLDLNLHRRHLSVGQRAMIAADLAQRRPGEGGDADDAAPTQAEAAAMMSVGERSVRQAKKIASEAAPEVVEGVRAGEVTLNAATGIIARSGLVSLKDEAERQVLPQAMTVDGRESPQPEPEEPAEEPTYTYECSMCGDDLQEDEVAWLEELPCCPTCFAQADPGGDPDDEEETGPSLPEGWGRLTDHQWMKKKGNLEMLVDGGEHNGYGWQIFHESFRIVGAGHTRSANYSDACSACDAFVSSWIKLAMMEPNALIDTPAAYSAHENEFMGEMAAGESLDDVVGV